MIPSSYIIFQSPKAMDEFYAAGKLAPLKIDDIQYISNEMAAANLEIAILHHEAFDTPFS